MIDLSRDFYFYEEKHRIVYVSVFKALPIIAFTIMYVPNVHRLMIMELSALLGTLLTVIALLVHYHFMELLSLLHIGLMLTLQKLVKYFIVNHMILLFSPGPVKKYRWLFH